MRADAEEHEPFRSLRTVSVRLRISQAGHFHLRLSLNLLLGSVLHEHRLASPLERGVLAERDVVQVDLDLGQREHLFGRRQNRAQVTNGRLAEHRTADTHGGGRQVGEASAFVDRLLVRLRWVFGGVLAVGGHVGYFDVGVCQSDLLVACVGEWWRGV